MRVYVESGVNLGGTDETVAWTFDLRHWGLCGQGSSEHEAVAALLEVTRETDAEVIERIDGDERAFDFDRRLPLLEERRLTLEILAAARPTTIDLVRGATDAQLDWVDPDRGLPEWATWQTARQLAWHIVDCESRYYLPRTGCSYREPASNLIDELFESEQHVRRTIMELPAETLAHETEAEVWTSVKLLRRLAWHERGEIVVLRELLKKTEQSH